MIAKSVKRNPRGQKLLGRTEHMEIVDRAVDVVRSRAYRRVCKNMLAELGKRGMDTRSLGLSA